VSREFLSKDVVLFVLLNVSVKPFHFFFFFLTRFSYERQRVYVAMTYMSGTGYMDIFGRNITILDKFVVNNDCSLVP